MSDFSSLFPFGFSPTLNDQLPPGTEPARVTRHDGPLLSVVTATGPRSVRNSPKLEPQPTVGDWVALDEKGIVATLERSSLLRRNSADDSGAQALAANVDIVLITCGVDRPVKPGRIQRSVTLAWDAGATPILVLTKARDAAAVDLPQLELEHPGVRVIVTSALEGIGVAEVAEAIAGRTAVLLGESGAGKSTLTNALLGFDAMDTGGQRSDAKGKHTTTSRNLHVVPSGGVIIDTPGIRSVGLFTDHETLDASFVDIAELAEECQFADCHHNTEPGCRVLDALESGELPRARFDSWRRLQREVAAAILRKSPRELRKRGKQFSRAAKLGANRKRDV